MKRIAITAAPFVAAGLAVSLTACATPTYPTSAGYVAPAPLQPRYPTHAEARAAGAADQPVVAPRVEATGPAPGTDAKVAAPPPPAQPMVESRPLPPAGPTMAPPLSGAGPGAGPGATYAPAPAPVEAQPGYEPQASAYRAAPPRVRREPGRIVAGGEVISASRMFRDYEVQKGDHLDAIARDLETSRKVLMDANHLKSPDDLRPGQHLKVPVAKAYVAQSGDTVIVVAKRFGVSPSQLADLNNISLHGRLRVGDKLALPANFHDHGPTRLSPEMIVERAVGPAFVPRQTSRVYSAPPAAGPYVPSRAALEAAARHAAENPQPTVAYAPAPDARYAPPRSSPVIEGSTSDLQIAAAGRGRFIWPVKGEILSAFGVKGVGRRNDGVDVRAPQGTVVRAAAAGEVVYAGDQVPGFGNLVLVKHADGWVTAYAHLDRAGVQMRQAVMQGQEIGQVGASGGVAEPQLHFEVRYAPGPTDKAKPIDPLLVLPQ